MKQLKHRTSIVAAIQDGGRSAEDALKELYRSHRTQVLGYLRKQGAGREEAKDLFQDAVIAAFENISAGKFRGDSSLNSYLISIARFLWINRQRREQIKDRVYGALEFDDKDLGYLPVFLAQEAKQQVATIFQSLGEDCHKTLSLSIYYDYSMKEIAEQMSYSSEQVARNKKYRCLSRLRKLMGKEPGIEQLLKNLGKEG